MKTLRWLLLLPVLVVHYPAFAQTSVVDFSTFSMGYDVAPSSSAVVTFVVGQQAADDIKGLNTRVQSGFINSLVPRSGVVISAIKPDTAFIGETLQLQFRLPPSVTTFAESLHYRKGGEHRFVAAPLQRSNDTIRVSIPPTAVTLRGIEYFVTFFSNQGAVRFPLIGVDTIRVRFRQFASVFAMQPRRYRMIAVPAELNDTSLRGVLEDDLGPYNPTIWRLFRWERGRYAEYPNIGASFTPGTAFWLVTRTGGGFDIENGRSVSSIAPQAVALDTGWNQIASPYAFPIEWGDLIASVNVSPAYYYDGVSPYQLNITILQPWEGYFVENRTGEAIVISVPPVEALPGTQKAGSLTELSGRDLVVQLSAASSSDLRDVYNYVGFKEQATAGDDRLDLHEPPPIGDYVQLSIADGKWFAANFKPPSADGEAWDIVTRSTLPQQDLIVRLEQHGVLPAGFKIFVLDKDESVPLSLQDGAFSVRTREALSVRSLKLIIGTEAFAESQSGGIPLVPLAYALDQNFPNPFNPSTTIRYQLSKRSRVRLEVFNVVGQLVKTLVDAEQVTGVHTVRWDGMNESGVPVASGMYVYRLRAGTFIASRKAMLLR